jgi:serine/threonine protein kinase
MTADRWSRLSARHNAWLAADAQERMRLRAQISVEEPDLADDVAELAASGGALDGFLETPAFVLAAQDLARDASVLRAGVTIGPYRIESLIARGGMGHVYRATDVRLAREVALKVLPGAALADPDRVARFLQEAQLTASLDHPNVVRVFDVGVDRGQPYLVAELLHGGTLRARLDREPIPVRDAVAIAADIGRGLMAAHAAGLVHRDLKPENIYLSRSGVTKILDFGVAKLTHAEADLRVAPTLPGVVFGTAGYLAPEQIRGVAVDHRADLFAVGCMLFEMLAGHRAFAREGTIDTLHAIVHDPAPDLPPQRHDVPPALVAMVKRLLAKSPDQRFQSAADLVWSLEQIGGAGAPSDSSQPVRPAGPPVRRRIWSMSSVALVAVATAAVSAGAVWLLQDRTSEPTVPLTQLPWTLPEGLVLDSAPVVSPDSRSIAFIGEDGTGSRLFVRPLRSLQPVMIPATEGAKQPFWSPDSRSVAYFAQGRLWKVAVADGGAPVPISDAPDARGGTWSRSGVIVFAPSLIGSGLVRVSENGGRVEPATLLDTSKSENSHWWPSFLPDGIHFLYFVRASGDGRRGVYIGRSDRPAAMPGVPVFESESEAIYAPLARTGMLLSAAGGGIEARAFDPERLALTADPRMIGVPAGAKTPYHSALMSVSPDVLVHVPSSMPFGGKLVVVGRSGLEERRAPEFEVQNWVRLSPDGLRLARTRIDGVRGRVGLWVEDLQRRVLTAVTTGDASGAFPVWSPDGNRLAYVSTANAMEQPNLVISSADGSEIFATLPCPRPTCELTDWSPDGHLVLNVIDGAARDVWTVEARAGGRAHPLRAASFTERDARISPDGRWIAYTSEQSGRSEVVVEGLSGRPQRIAVSGDGGEQPVWRRDGRELLFVHPQTGGLHAVAVLRNDGATLTLGTAARLSVPPISRHRGTDYDISPDGSRVYMVDRTPGLRPREIGIILGWRALLN